MSHAACYLPMDRRQALCTGTSIPLHASGTCLFADLAGFTRFTEQLAQRYGARRGAEELTRSLQLLFSALTEEVYRQHGVILVLSGDAITCWFEGDRGQAAIAAALAMEDRLQPVVQQLEAREGFRPQFKLGMATGKALRLEVGDPELQRLDVLTGELLTEMAAAERLAAPGELVIGPSTLRTMPEGVLDLDWLGRSNLTNRFARVVDFHHPPPPNPWDERSHASLSNEILRPYLLRPVWERLEAGQGEALAELRPVATLFLAFGGIDYDSDPAAPARLDQWIRHVQRIAHERGGNLLNLTVGDKGSYCLIAFGAPIAYADSVLRAVSTALELMKIPPELSWVYGPAMGLTWGDVYVGSYGGTGFRAWSLIGREVNLAARLMGLARPGELLTEAHMALAWQDQLETQSLGTRQVRGVEQPVHVFRVKGWRRPGTFTQLARGEDFLFGRDSTLASARSQLEHLGEKGRVLWIEGQPGIGKTRVAAAIGLEARRSGMLVLATSCQSLDQNVTWHVWKSLLRPLLQTHGFLDDSGLVPSGLERLQQLLPLAIDRIPLLGELLDVTLPESPALAALDVRLRREALLVLVIELLETLTRLKPTLLILEDVHWMDHASATLTLMLARSTPRFPLVLCLTTRTRDTLDTHLPAELNQIQPDWMHELNPLEPLALRQLLEYEAKCRISPIVLGLVEQTSRGNPLFGIELLRALREGGQLQHDEIDGWRPTHLLLQRLLDGGCLEHQGETLVLVPERLRPGIIPELPDSLQGIILAGIDRLSELEKRVLKVASVIARAFTAPMMDTLLQGLSGTIRVKDTLDRLVQRRLLSHPEGDIERYAFEHTVILEVTYETLLYEQRRQLHTSVADAYESSLGLAPSEDTLLLPELEAWYPILAHHFRQAEMLEKERLYQLLAGEAHALRFANLDANTALSRALELTEASRVVQRYRILRARIEVGLFLGHYAQVEEDIHALVAEAHTREQSDRVLELTLRRLTLLERTGRFPLLLEEAGRARMLASQLGVMALELDVMEASVTALWRLQRLEEAGVLALTAITQAHALGLQDKEARLLRQLGTIRYLEGRLSEAHAHVQAAIQAQERLGNVAQVAVSIQNMMAIGFAAGDLGLTEEYGRKSIAITRGIGFRGLYAISLNNLAGVMLQLGETAESESLYRSALEIFSALGDHNSLCIVYENLGKLYLYLNRSQEALHASEQALLFHKGTGRTPSLTLTRLLARAQLAVGLHEAALLTFKEAEFLAAESGDTAAKRETQIFFLEFFRCIGDLKTLEEQVNLLQHELDIDLVHRLAQPLVVLCSLGETALSAADSTFAQQILAMAHTWLEETAKRITDPKKRSTFLRQTPGAQSLQNLGRWIQAAH